MTIEEYKQKLDEHLGMVGKAVLESDNPNWIAYSIVYNSPSGVPMISYRVVKSKQEGIVVGGWYESETRGIRLPDFDEDTRANRLKWLKEQSNRIRTRT